MKRVSQSHGEKAILPVSPLYPREKRQSCNPGGRKGLKTDLKSLHRQHHLQNHSGNGQAQGLVILNSYKQGITENFTPHLILL